MGGVCRAAEPPVFSRTPQSVAVPYGSTVRLSADTTSTGIVSWEWRKDGLLLPGETKKTLTLPNCQVDDTAEYYAVVKDSHGGRWSLPAAVLVRPATHTAGRVDTDFADAGIVGMVNALAPLADGACLVAGNITATKDGPLLGNILKLTAIGDADHGFRQGKQGANSTIYALAASAGKILVAGDFTSFDGESAAGLVSLTASGERDPQFSPVLPVGVQDVRLVHTLSDGRAYVAGRSRNGTVVSDWLIRLHADGRRDTAFVSPTFLNGRVRALGLRSDGKLWVAGNFFRSGTSTTQYNRVVLLRNTGAVDPAFLPPSGTNSGANAEVQCLSVSANGSAVVGGVFSKLNGVPRFGLARVQANGSLDTSFQAPVPDDIPMVIAEDPLGQLLVGGDISQWGSHNFRGIVRLTSNGALDPSWSPPSFDGPVNSLLRHSGRLLVGGNFTSPHAGVLQLLENQAPVDNSPNVLLPISQPTGLFRPKQHMASYLGPQAVADSSSLAFPLQMNSAGIIQELRIWLDVTHPEVQGLHLSLEPPASLGIASIPLFTGDAGYRHGANVIQCCFSSQAVTSIQQSAAPFTGTWQAEGILPQLHGREQQGTWILRIADVRTDAQSATVHRVTLETITRAGNPTYSAYTALPTTPARVRSFVFAHPPDRSPQLSLSRLPTGGWRLTHDCWPQDTASNFRYWVSADLATWFTHTPLCEKWILPDRAFLRLTLPSLPTSQAFWRVEGLRWP